VLAGNGAAHLLALGHHAAGDFLTVAEHIRVIGVDGDVDVAVAVARVHMARHDEARGLHVGLDFLDGFGEMGILFPERGQKSDTAGMHLVVRDFLALKAAYGRLGDIGEFFVEFPVFHGETGETPHFLQGLAVGLGRALEVHLLQERGKIGDAVNGNDHVFVDFEAGRPFGDNGKAVPVFPEAVSFLGVARHGDIHVLLLLNNLNDVVDALVEEIGIIAVHLHGDHGNGMAGVLGALGLVVDGLDVLGVELFHGRNMREVALLADAVAQADELADHNSGRAHAAAEEFHGHDAAVFGLRMDGEADLGDDAVRAFLLHSGESAEDLVGHVLAKSRPADLVALQAHHIAHAAAHVLDDEDRGLIGKNLVAGVVLALHGDDFTSGGDHAPPQEVVDGGAVLEGHGAAGVLGNVASYGRGQLGSRIHGEKGACPVHGIDHVLGDASALTGHGHGLEIDAADGLHARHADDDGSAAGRHGAAGHARTAASRDEGELQFIGQLHDSGHLFGRIRLDNHKGQFHAEVRGVRLRGHQRGRVSQNALGGHNLAEFLDKMIPELHLSLVSGPEHGDALADGGGVVMG